ncbi:MAG TPA: S26 family signal peptidase [Gemmataceae bacterium]|nr:S26 family signal peptidase [Gemmataceae bacterium]
MPDEHVPTPSPHSSARFTTPSAVTSPSANNGALPKSEESTPPSNKGKHSAVPEMIAFGRWLLGCLIVAVGGWGILGLSLYLMLHYHVGRPELLFGALAVADLALFFWLERHFWLSHFMSLRIEPGTHAWHSAIMLWLFGLPGLLFRATHFHLEAEAQAATRSRPQPSQRSDSAREIVETIVFVVVLVLLLKSFAAEAFVIPTGSMAETLLGYQKQVTCPDCGYKFPINCSQEVDPEAGRSSPVYACECPNCRQHIHFRGAPPNFQADDSREIADPGWNSGDRVLVAKFVYDLFNKDPNRLDVVVFKYPGDDRFPTSGPHRNHVPMNYIKRLIGLSGETIAIRGGDLYYLSPEKSPHYDDYDKAKQDPEMMPTLWQKEHMHIDDEQARDRFKKGEFQIVRKDPENILSMMRIVFDNDHPSRLNPASTDRWKSPDGSWQAIAPHGLRHDSADSGHVDWLTYHHTLRDNQGLKPSLITDIMGYNTYQSASHERPQLDNNWVGDLILECEAAIDNPQGELTLELSHGVDRFQARWDLSTGTCTLVRFTNEVEQKLTSKPTALKKKGTYRLRFANVDRRLVVWVDGDLPFENGYAYSAPTELGPRQENDLDRPAGIGVRGAGVAIHKIKLFRDTYYTIGGTKQGFPHDADVRIDPVDPHTWTDLKTPPFVTLYVQPEHFLCLGDNSPESSDGRSWGVVPRRLMLGRALLVYYPFGRAGRIR